MTRFPVGRVLHSALLFVCAVVWSHSVAAQTLELGGITAELEGTGWRFVAAFEGSTNITTATLQPPGGMAIALACETVEITVVECIFEDPGFASLAALLVAYPAGSYELSLNGGARTAILPFGPIEPDGIVTVTDPLDGAASVSGTPTISYTHDCTNCVAIAFEITDLGAPVNVGLELFVFGIPPPSIGTVSYAELESFEGPKPSELPLGSYALVASTAVGTIDEATLTPGGAPFEYATAALISAESTFTVPEPTAFAAGLAVAAVLLVLAGARRRSSAVPPDRAPRAGWRGGRGADDVVLGGHCHHDGTGSRCHRRRDRSDRGQESGTRHAGSRRARRAHLPDARPDRTRADPGRHRRGLRILRRSGVLDAGDGRSGVRARPSAARALGSRCGSEPSGGLQRDGEGRDDRTFDVPGAPRIPDQQALVHLELDAEVAVR